MTDGRRAVSCSGQDGRDRDRRDASSYPELDVLTAVGGVFMSRRWVAGDDPAKAQVLDQALELLAAEIEARGVLADNPLPDLIDPGEGQG
jgi:hypothetical protein